MGGGIRIVSRIHLTMGILGSDWLRHARTKPEVLALLDPLVTLKIESGGQAHSKKALECLLDPGFHPIVVKIAKNGFWGTWGRERSQNRL